MQLSAGKRLGPYKIVSPIGSGGMGDVYRARDTRLSRDVAVKVLPEKLARDEERQRRFEVEARAAGALSHPNIVAIHEVGESAGIPYIAMEYVAGWTLRELLDDESCSAYCFEKILRFFPRYIALQFLVVEHTGQLTQLSVRSDESEGATLPSLVQQVGRCSRGDER